MKFCLAHIKSVEQIHIRTFDPASGNVEDKFIGPDDYKTENPQVLFYEPDQLDEALTALLEEEKKFCAVIRSKDMGLNYHEFAALLLDEGQKLLRECISKWVLMNNIRTLEEIFGMAKYLKDLWTNDRNTFFEELWFALRSNLGASELSLIYHDLDPEALEEEKEKLINSVIEGARLPQIRKADGPEDLLMSSYESYFGASFECREYSHEKGELTALASINGSPILIMAKIYQLNKLQNALISALFDGMQTKES